MALRNALQSALNTGQRARWSATRSVQLGDLSRLGSYEQQWANYLLSRGDLSSHRSGFGSAAEDKSRKQPVVYEGPLAGTLQKVKLLSLSTCCLSVSCGPALTFFTTSDISVIGKGAIASTMILLSASTTAALHWIASPYVRKLTWVPGSKEVEVELLSWMATSLRKTIRIADVRHPETQRPLVTFAANGNFYFIDKDKFPSEELLKKLAP